MRLKKGTKVEVLDEEVTSMGAWRSAVIISGNGRSYYVNYNPSSGCSEVQVGRVPRKAIRPCPPPVQGIEDWASGDIVEVYHNRLWKAATIVNADGRNNYTVRLLGCTEVLNSHRHLLRVRQVWEDDKWFVLGKGTQSRFAERKRLPGAMEKINVQNPCFTSEQCNGFPNPRVPINETTKRKSPLESGFGVHRMVPKKRRVIDKDFDKLQIQPENPLSLGKVDAWKKSLVDNNLYSSSTNGRTGFVKVDIGGSSDRFHVRTSATIDTDGCTSSVGSCDANGINVACSYANRRNAEDADEVSDAESVCGKEYKDKANSQNKKEKSLARARSSELRTYRRAVQSLFASGPFSWEEETNMSNLRQSLHISDDEHLALIRSLVSPGTRILIC